MIYFSDDDVVGHNGKGGLISDPAASWPLLTSFKASGTELAGLGLTTLSHTNDKRKCLERFGCHFMSLCHSATM